MNSAHMRKSGLDHGLYLSQFQNGGQRRLRCAGLALENALDLYQHHRHPGILVTLLEGALIRIDI